MKSDVDVAVIGAGVSGAAIARTLSAYQLDVALVEKEAEEIGRASCRERV